MFTWKAHLTESGLTVVSQQLDEELILQTNLELQKMDEPVPDREGLGRWALSIPLLKWVELRRKYPAMRSKDAQTRTKAYLAFMQSPESIPYRVRQRI